MGVLPPLGAAGRQAVPGGQVLLPLHEAAEDLLEVLHILVGGGGRILEIAVQGRLRHRQAPGVAEILHQEQLVF